MALQFDTLIQIIIPVTTFILGGLVTFLFQKYWRKKDITTESAKALVGLASDWYNQLEALRQSVNKADSPQQIENMLEDYVRNRKILPKMLYHLGVLRAQNVCPKLCAATDSFLKTLTSYEKKEKMNRQHFASYPNRVICKNVLRIRQSLKNSEEKINVFSEINFDDLDKSMQRVIHHAAEE